MRPVIRVCIAAPRAAPLITIPTSASQMPPKVPRIESVSAM